MGVPRWSRKFDSTLVVEIGNINDQQDGGRFISGTGGAYPGSGETLRVIERYTRVGPDMLEYRYTIIDPEVYVRPYTVLREWVLDNNYAVASRSTDADDSRN
jgi:hypothetical protein